MNKKDKIVNILLEGGVVVMPTDTVFGVFTKVGNEAGVKKIYDIKKRPAGKPLPILISSLKWVWRWVEYDKMIDEACGKSWPGAVTFILKTLNGNTVGLRMPDLPDLLEIIDRTGPLYATSANISGGKAPVSLDEIPGSIKNSVDLSADFQKPLSGKPSKIIDLSGGKEKVLRK